MYFSHSIGVDEAGRGPLAGPVAVGVAVVPFDFDWALIPGVGDSKKVATKNREAVFRRAQILKKEGSLDYAISLISASVIDRIGITRSVQKGITRCFARLNLEPAHVSVKLDGLLSAPSTFIHQETIVRGDESELVIGLASILAKVTRDRFMIKLGKQYPCYGFAEHKGYGTRLHCAMIRAQGLSHVHRSTFCRNFL